MDAAFDLNTKNPLADTSNSTCLKGNELSHDVPMEANIMFTWMRFVTNRPGQMDRVNITFLSSSGAEVAQSSPLTRIYLSDTMFDIYGELQDRFKTIRLNFDTPETRQSFCTMQVSLGRNVAIKQNAFQSSEYNSYAGRAVDGETDPRKRYSCTTTKPGEDSPYWIVNISLPVIVNLYDILPGWAPDGYRDCTLRQFRLESYFESTQVQQYDDRHEHVYWWISLYPVDTSPITSVKLTVSKYFLPDQLYGCSDGKPILNICEMMIFGDVVCPQGKWGRACENNCNCQDPSDSCYVSTGMCPSGCKAGFHGPGCKKECADGQWGISCRNQCGNCLNGKCSKVSGECPSGCDQGYKMPLCTQECDVGFHGYSCKNHCPENCRNNTCDNVEGLCIKCEAGYQGALCAQECNATLYGEDCATPCSDKCIDQLCHHITGVCKRCPHGKLISKDCSQANQIPFDNLPSLIPLPEYVILTTNQGKLYCVGEIQAQRGSCPKTDILLLVETSSNVAVSDINNYIIPEFQYFAQKFEIGKDNTLFAAISFGNMSERVFNFEQGSTPQSVQDQLTALPVRGGTTVKTHEALRGAINAFAPPSLTDKGFYRARLTDDVAKVVIVVTESDATHPVITDLKAKTLKAVAGISVYVVGVGCNVNTTQINVIASSESNVYLRPDYTSFGSVLSIIASEICSSEE